MPKYIIRIVTEDELSDGTYNDSDDQEVASTTSLEYAQELALELERAASAWQAKNPDPMEESGQ